MKRIIIIDWIHSILYFSMLPLFVSVGIIALSASDLNFFLKILLSLLPIFLFIVAMISFKLVIINENCIQLRNLFRVEKTIEWEKVAEIKCEKVNVPFSGYRYAFKKFYVIYSRNKEKINIPKNKKNYYILKYFWKNIDE